MIPICTEHIYFGCSVIRQAEVIAPVKIDSCPVGSEGPGVSVSEERQSPAESSAVSVIYNPYASLSIEQQRQKLPVFKVQKFFLIY